MTRIYTKKDSDEVREIFNQACRESKEKNKKIVTKEEKQKAEELERNVDNMISVEEFRKMVRELRMKEIHARKKEYESEET